MSTTTSVRIVRLYSWGVASRPEQYFLKQSLGEGISGEMFAGRQEFPEPLFAEELSRRAGGFDDSICVQQNPVTGPEVEPS